MPKSENIERLIIEKARARRDQWHHEIVNVLPDVEEIGRINEDCIIGSFSLTFLSTRRRVLQAPDLIEIAPNLFETPSTLARDYLTFKYKRGSRVSHNQFVETSEVNPTPLFAVPCHFNHGFYIDIKSCYFSLMLLAGWNLDYWPGRWVQPGTPPLDFPWPTEKVARNCLVSAGGKNKMMTYRKDKGLEEVNKGNPLANVLLIRFISDTLNAIATEARDAGAVYVNTDGFITPDAERAARVAAIIGRWGLNASIKGEGSGSVTGPGNYRVGDHRSRRGRDGESAIHNIFEVPHAAWLNERVRWLAAIASK